MNIKFKFEPRDLWVGVYWNLTKSIESQYRRLDVYICLIPTLLIHLCFEWGWRNQDKEYNAYLHRAWQQGMTGMDYREWKRQQAKEIEKAG